MLLKNLSLVSLLLLIHIISICQDKHEYSLVKTYHIASPGWWDYVAINNNKLYVSHATQVNILNEQTGDSVGVILNTQGVHGIAFDNKLNRGYTSNGKTNNVTVFNLSDNAVVTHIATGQNPDAICYEPFSQKIITCNGSSTDLSVIDPLTNKVIATIDVGGKPETAVADGKGMLYVNIEDKNEIVNIDLKNFSVKHHWSISPGENPTGLAIDTHTRRLFAGCEGLMVILDAGSGKVVDTLPIGGGCDGVAFDSVSGTVFTSNGEGSITVIKENPEIDFKLTQTVRTKKGARTIAIDQDRHTLFLPAADFAPLDQNASKGTRPKMIEGSFQVLVVQ